MQSLFAQFPFQSKWYHVRLNSAPVLEVLYKRTGHDCLHCHRMSRFPNQISGFYTLKIKVALLNQGSKHSLLPWEQRWGQIHNPFFHYDDGIHIPFLLGRQKVGDDVQSGCIIELYQLVVYEILDMVLQMVTFFQRMPLGPKMVFTLFGWIKTSDGGPSLGLENIRVTNFLSSR